MSNDGTSGFNVQCVLRRPIDSITAQEDSEKQMWTTYMKEVKESDKLITAAWKEGANALVVYVTPDLTVNPNDNLVDRSFLRSRRRFYLLSEIVTR